MTAHQWTMLVPVKGGTGAKSRLPERVRGTRRADLARALAHDTIAAICAAPSVGRVVVIAGGPDVADTLGALASLVTVVEQPEGARLNEAIAHAAKGVQGPTAVILGDVPAARPEDIEAALADAAALTWAVVADADGTGTTMLAAFDGVLAPRFGPGSLARHVAAGYSPLAVAPSLRADVDTDADLTSAVALGVGSHTAAVLGLVPRGALAS